MGLYWLKGHNFGAQNSLCCSYRPIRKSHLPTGQPRITNINNYFPEADMEVFELIKKEGLRQGLSPRTIRTYIYCVQKFLRTYQKAPHEVTKNDIEKHIQMLIKQNSSGNTVNVYINALKFFYEDVFKKSLTININFMRVQKRLPEFLTQEETVRLFQAINNPKHQLMIKLLYATGMRVSELTSLNVKDFEFNNNYGWIRNGKGGKDRLFVIAVKLKDELLKWIKNNGLIAENWLFPGNGSSHYSPASIRAVIKKAALKAGISKNVHPHTLRHSFATHLIENGYAVTEVQPLLGHGSLETTMIYLHMASPQLLKVKSPYDNLEY